MTTVNIGLGNYVAVSRIVAIVNPESAPIKRMINEAKDNGTAVDATYGRRTRAVLVLDTNQLVLSSLQPETIINKLNKGVTLTQEEQNTLVRAGFSTK